MVFHENILKRVRAKEKKRGKYYPEKDGILYNRFKFFYVVATLFANVWNFMFVISVLILNGEDETYFSNSTLQLSDYIVVTVCSIILIGAFFASKYNDNLIVALSFGGSNLVACGVLIYYYAKIQMQANGIVLNYYWRHLAPLSITALCALAMSLIVIIAYIKLKKHYNEVLEEVYEDYNALETDDKPDWDEYVKNYKFKK